jgi:hypothetical protein
MFNHIDRDVEKAMTCAVNACWRKSYKKHKWTEEYTHGIYSIRCWLLRRKILDNKNTLNDSTQTLQCYADKAGLLILYNTPTSITTCTLGISNARYRIKKEIIKQAPSK